MTKSFFVFFSILLCACSGAVSRAQSSPPLDAVTAQSNRVTGDPVLRSLLKPFEKKYRVRCRVPSGDDPSGHNPKWTCLNNNACSYKLVVTCYQKSGQRAPALQMEFSGFDDGTNNAIQALHVTYLLN